MKQIIQYQKTGDILVEELTFPRLKEGEILVRNHYSAVSAGTEKTSVKTAQASLVGKAKARPDLVKQVMDNVKKEGLFPTINKVRNRLDNYKELGYSSAGIVIESKSEKFKVGDRVACAGGAYHAELITVPQNLAVKIPDNVDFGNAAFTTIASIALQGIRQADIRLGENVAVIGLGLIGLMTVQLLNAGGIKTIGLDISEVNFELAKTFGAEACYIADFSSIPFLLNETNGFGFDAVIITAGTKSNVPIELALQIARKRGSIVVVGAVGMDIPRSPFYEKELMLKISTSYGPGRYDKVYEERGIDYPYAYVRWTENRNMEAVLNLLSSKKIDFKPLITHVFPIDEGLKAYDIITGKIKEKFLGILIKYPSTNDLIKERESLINNKSKVKHERKIKVGFIGAGNFAQSNLLPHVKNRASLVNVATSTPINAKSVAEKFDFRFFTTFPQEIIENKDINTIFIATHHDSHAEFVINALKKGKHVFVEKPLAVTLEQLEEIRKVYTGDAMLMVGFNRRFSSPIIDIKQHFKNVNAPLFINYRVNAGFIPKDHWVQDPKQGGRIIGEVCHFIDTLQFLTDSFVKSIYAVSIRAENNELVENDTVNISLEFSNGSVGNIQYIATGASAVPKEYLEIYGGEQTAIMYNFTRVEYYTGRKHSKKKYNGKKGHKEEVQHFLNAIEGKEPLQLNFESLYHTTSVTFKILESLQNKKIITL